MKIVNLAFLFLILTTLSCKKYNEEFIGPPLGAAAEDFSVVGNSFTVNDNFPDFSVQPMYFQAQLSSKVNWKITIVGQQSGAIKTIEGYSNVLDASNATWNGTTDTKLFTKGEQVTATFTAFGWNGELSTSLQIQNTGYRGIIMGSFETFIKYSSTSFKVDDYYWFSNFESTEQKYVDTIRDNTAPEGKYAFRLYGTDNNSSYYIGKAGIGKNGNNFNFGSSDPNQVYFNFYVKGAGSNSLGKLVLEMFEDDDLSGSVNYSTEDKNSYQINLNFEGWKLYSIRYSDFTHEQGVNNTKEPNKISDIGFYTGLTKLDNGLDVDTSIDFFTITVGGPLIP